MFEKVNPSHPDKVADRIAGAIVDLSYSIVSNPHIAVEVMAGHGECFVITETDVSLKERDIKDIIYRLSSIKDGKVIIVKQDEELNKNQSTLHTGDNGIFSSYPFSNEEKTLVAIAENIYSHFPYDGKYIYTEDKNELIICQSNAREEEIRKVIGDEYKLIINPLGEWRGGFNTDSGLTNRKLGSDMARSITGGGLHGKDLSKADVSVNLFLFEKAEKERVPFEGYCSIGSEVVYYKKKGEKVWETVPFSHCTERAGEIVKKFGGFEKLAEWGIVR